MRRQLLSTAPRIWARVGSARRPQQPVKEMLPARRMDSCLLRREAAVNDAEASTQRSIGECELDLGSAGRQIGVAGNAPAHQNPAGWVNLQVAAADRHAVDIDLEGAARYWLELGVLAHPADHGGWISQVPEHLLDRGGQVDFGGERPRRAAALTHVLEVRGWLARFSADRDARPRS